MNKIHILFAFLALLSYIVCSDIFCSDFEYIKKTTCEQITFSNETYTGCSFIEDKCTPFYKECDEYKGSNETICNLISPSNSLGKCVLIGNECEEYQKECSEYTGNGDCTELDPGDESKSRCILVNDKCKSHFLDCRDADSKSCDTNIPLNPNKKCKWENDACQTIDKNCEDYKLGNFACSSLKPKDEKKKCIYDNYKNECYEYYGTCEGANSDICGTIKPLDNNNESLDILYKCEFSDETCQKVKKKCNDYKPGEVPFEYCEQYFYPSIPQKQKCYYHKIEDKCYELYISCEDYNKQEESLKNKKTCELIQPYKVDSDYYKCVFDEGNKNCEKKKLACSEITEKDMCNSHSPLDEKKMCVFVDNKCIEEYKSCEHYDGEETKNKDVCESIILFNADLNIDYTKQCVFNEDTCEEKNLNECFDYIPGKNKLYCTNIKLSKDKRKCAFNNNNCVEQYLKCDDYTESDKKTCESIIIDDDLNKCGLVNDKSCQQIPKLCNDYTGTDENECSQYSTDNSKKKCYIINEKCTEHYIYCSDYHGNDKDICESIIPHSEDGEDFLDYYKCVLTDDGCIKTPRDCSEAKTAEDCNNITPIDTKKACVFSDSVCTEQYKDCDYDENVEKDICESIILSDSNSKCVFKEGETEEDPNTCTKEAKTCEDFKIESLKNTCQNISPTNIRKKCIFSNNSCVESTKTCLELSNNPNVNENICKSSTTSDPSNKICSLKANKSGCEEVNKPEETKTTTPKEKEGNQSQQQKQQEGEEGEEGQETPGDFAKEKYLSKFIYIILCLLL